MPAPHDSNETHEAAAVGVPAKDPKRADQPPKKDFATKEAAAREDELTEEAQKVRDEVELLLQRIQDPELGVAELALGTLSLLLQGATSTMTSVPLPLKFLRPSFPLLESHYQTLPDSHPLKTNFADILSVVATVVPNNERKALKYRLASKPPSALLNWGQEYLRNISGEIAAEFLARQQEFLKLSEENRAASRLDLEDLFGVVRIIVPHYVKHRNVIDAMDLLLEVQRVEFIKEFLDAATYWKATEYLLAVSEYSATEEEFRHVLGVVYDIQIQHRDFGQAVRVALKLQDHEKVLHALEACEDSAQKKQIGYMLAQFQYKLSDDVISKDPEALEVLSNEWLSGIFRMLATELDVLEPKAPKDVCKAVLPDRADGSLAKEIITDFAPALVSGLVNAAFGSDALLLGDSSDYVFKSKNVRIKRHVTAALGLLMLWDIDEGTSRIDAFRWSDQADVQTGSFLASSLMSCGIKSRYDVAWSMLEDQLESCDTVDHLPTLLGLGLAHAGWRREELLHALVPFVVDSHLLPEVNAIAALSLALSFVGSCDEGAAEAIVQVILEWFTLEPEKLSAPLSYLLAVALGLLFLGSRDACETTCETIGALGDHPYGTYATATILGCAYAGSGDVLKVQTLLATSSKEDPKKEEEKGGKEAPTAEDAPAKAKADAAAEKPATATVTPSPAPQVALAALPPPSAPAPEKAAPPPTPSPPPCQTSMQAASVVSIALVSLGEYCGTEMNFRTMEHILQYGSIKARRAVPLALALLSASDPRPTVIDTLAKLAHDPDPQLSWCAILALGFIGAGSNNARIAELLRQLATYCASRAPDGLFCVRVAQGLLHLGKGLLTISPLQSDGFLLCPVTLASLIVVMHTCLFLPKTVFAGHPYLLFAITPALRPRMLVTLNEKGDLLSVPVRVGQAVDIAGQAGQPRSITGFQTHTTPVLLSAGERAELGTTDYAPVTPSCPLEGVVILRKVPESEAAAAAAAQDT